MGHRHQHSRAPLLDSVVTACGTSRLELRTSGHEFQPDGFPYELPHPMTTDLARIQRPRPPGQVVDVGPKATAVLEEAIALRTETGPGSTPAGLPPPGVHRSGSGTGRPTCTHK
ncbi:hypothetical protein GCM10009603_18520 [Nocardiopsis exhalans]